MLRYGISATGDRLNFTGRRQNAIRSFVLMVATLPENPCQSGES